MRFKDKIAIVTGGASGIGAATVTRLVEDGAKVLVADLNNDLGNALVSELPDGAASFYRGDVSDRSDVERMVVSAVETFGGLDILVNNAGIGSFGETPDLDPDEWHRVIDIDLHSVFYGCRAAIPEMRKRGGGAIVNTASISGLGGDFAFTAYNAAKGAVVNYTKALAVDHAKDNIRANALCPGLILTGLTESGIMQPPVADVWQAGIPMGRYGTPEEMANVICFLASDEASFMTGSIVVADGGQTAHTGQPNLPKVMSEMMPTG